MATFPMCSEVPTRLGQVFLNLIVNAAQAIPEGNTSLNHVTLSTTTDASGRVVISVADTGSGISPAALRKLFTPFFSTKPPTQGTGLGLAICHRIVTEMGGEIAVETEVGRGTTFRVSLPPALESPASSRDRRTSDRPAAFAGRILVVDDELAQLTTLRRVLGKEHFVQTAASGREALMTLEQGLRFDVVVCDLMMPEMSGVDFHEALERVAPDLARRTIFLTGAAFTERTRAFLDRSRNQVLRKPVSAPELRSAVRRLLEETPPLPAALGEITDAVTLTAR